ncbi:hypothetical protein G9F32_03195 [Acinetobacter sp. 194]|uniref:hypothetical protein n=1 Tax=Acinetobacter shaoyimingii TaxID=2715164 RepID=UPI00140B986D|nr:hypothetical protein [Acinetobacter shaoyimingii]NHB57039.1 hypothetical protein [Acinetobacter shaoyimingii]
MILYIKKNGMFLADSTNVIEELEYDDYSDIDANSNVQFEWVSDANRARVFTDMRTAKTFIAKKRGEFWRGAEVVRK